MDFEKLGSFYLGKEYDVAKKKLTDRLLMYDARDLTTHAVCVGMTGSGKTGLCIDLLEEAAIDNVPAIIIDPKGDITNLLLTFPDLNPGDFRPWINVDDARRKGLSEEEFAAKQAELWRKGLASWGEDGARIRMLRESADLVIYTPGSDAGIPVSILQSFAAPPLSWDTEAELLRERVQGTVSALLGLIGVDADPVRSREHILLANLFEHFWRRGEDLNLPKLILAIQTPPIRQLGVFDIDTFFPQKERFGLAIALNNIIAAPSFQSWLQGQPLDIAGFLSTPEGKPRHSIFYIAHLSDAERMFFVTMLLNQLVTWMRAQAGTTSLRALLYIDEVFGYFPPVANPPSKKPLLTLMKQARAFGLGVVLTTQNPADLDYKGLTNAGTWFIGRLQTERDKDRLLEGLESASAQAGAALNRKQLGEIMSDLGKRVFLLHNVHEPAPVTFQTRWAMSYLRGPLTRPQVRTLMGGRAPDTPVVAPQKLTSSSLETRGGMAAASAAPSSQPTPAPEPASPHPTAPPALPAAIQQVYLPTRIGSSSAEKEITERARERIEVQERHLLYIPALLGMGRVHFVKKTRALNVNEAEDFTLLAQPPRGVGVVRWEQAQEPELTPRDLLDRPEPEAYFDELPETINEAKELAALKKELQDHLYRTRTLSLLYSPAAKLYSRPDEDEREFRMRLRQEARELRDAEVDKLEDRHATKLRTLEDRLRRAKTALGRKESASRARKQDAFLSAGETVLSLFSGRRRSISATANKFSRTSTAKADVDAAEEQVAVLQEDIKDLLAEFKEDTAAITARWEEAQRDLDTLPVQPRRNDIEVTLFALAWTPHWQIAYRDRSGITQTALLPAY
ncbi:MAG: type IV secretion system DNA-binding domain-containing protein [Anaerolineae bacterium]|nr:type IV secretion system DNA-binding domain-containing protein [Anaerolineae bacterium]